MPYKDPLAKLAYDRAWRVKHREALRAYQRTYHLTNAETIAQHNHANYLANKEKRNAQSQANYYANHEAKKAQQRAYMAAHRAEAIARTKAWRLANPEKRQNEQVRRRSRKKDAPLIDLSHAQWVEIQAAQAHRCAYCGKRCKGRLTQDHITPVGPTGPHTVHNIVGACASCNAKKRRKAPPKSVQPLLLTIAPKRKPRRKKD